MIRNVVAVAVLLSAAGCGSGGSEKSTNDAGFGGKSGAGGGAATGSKSNGSGDTAGTGDQGGAGSGSGFKLSWSVAEPLPATDASASVTDTAPSIPIVGMKVCVHGHAEIACVTSGADGRFTLQGLPPRAALVLTFDKAGYVKASKTVVTASTDMQGVDIIYILPDSFGSPVTLESGKGGVSFLAITPTPGSNDPNAVLVVKGVSVTLSPARGDGPFFSDRQGKFQRSATKTLNGLAYFYNLDPGEYALTFDSPNFDCAALNIGLAAWGIPLPPNGVKFTVLADTITTEMLVYCTPKSVLVGADGG